MNRLIALLDRLAGWLYRFVDEEDCPACGDYHDCDECLWWWAIK